MSNINIQFKLGDLVVLMDQDPKGVEYGFVKGVILKIVGMPDELVCPHCGAQRALGAVSKKYSCATTQGKCGAIPPNKLKPIADYEAIAGLFSDKAATNKEPK